MEENKRVQIKKVGGFPRDSPLCQAKRVPLLIAWETQLMDRHNHPIPWNGIRIVSWSTGVCGDNYLDVVIICNMLCNYVAPLQDKPPLYDT